MAVVIQEGTPGLARHGAWRWTLWWEWRTGQWDPRSGFWSRKTP